MRNKDWIDDSNAGEAMMEVMGTHPLQKKSNEEEPYKVIQRPENKTMFSIEDMNGTLQGIDFGEEIDAEEYANSLNVVWHSRDAEIETLKSDLKEFMSIFKSKNPGDVFAELNKLESKLKVTTSALQTISLMERISLNDATIPFATVAKNALVKIELLGNGMKAE